MGVAFFWTTEMEDRRSAKQQFSLQRFNVCVCVCVTGPRLGEGSAEGAEDAGRLPGLPAARGDRREQRRGRHFLVPPLPGRPGAHAGRLQPAA